MGERPGARRAPAPGEAPAPGPRVPGTDENQALPFLHRYMLNYGPEAVFELQIRTQSSTNINLRIAGGTRSALINHKLLAGSGADAKTIDIRIDDFPIFLAVTDIGGGEIQGNTFVTVNLIINGQIVACLMSGYVYPAKPLTYPDNKLQDLLPNRGEISIEVGADPAAGAEAILIMDDNEIWRVMWAAIQLVTDANAANRRVHLVFTPDTAGSTDLFGSTDQTASLTRDYSFAQYGVIPDEIDSTKILVNLPNELWLEPNTAITTATTNIQAADNFGPIVIMREKFYVGN